MQSVLATLRDIEGIIGSFLLDEQGNLLARDMPSMFDDDTLAFASTRMGRLRAAFEVGAERFEGCTARFGSHLIILRPAEARSLCVMCPVGTNMAMLEMALNLVARRLSAPKSAAEPGTPRHWTMPAPPSLHQALPPTLGTHDTHGPRARSPLAAPPVPAMPPPLPHVAAAPAPDYFETSGEPTRLFRGRPLR